MANRQKPHLIVLILLSLFSPSVLWAQCGNDNVQSAAVSSIPCGTFDQVAIGPGTYATFPVVAGATYEFNACGSYNNNNSLDTRLTGFNGASSTVEFFNDDVGPGGITGCTNCTTTPCTAPNSNALDAGLTWTSTFNGTLRVLMDRYLFGGPNSCDPCSGGAGGTDCTAFGSAVLNYRQVNNLSITSSNADICAGLTRTLTASPAGGTFSGTGVSGTTFTAPATAGVYTITYTLGSCSATQNITVFSNSVAPTSLTASQTTICVGPSVTLTANGSSLGSGAKYYWYTNGSCTGVPFDSTLVNTLTVTPSATTTYSVHARGTCNTTACQSVTVNVRTFSTDPTGISATQDNFCPGTATSLSVLGGSLGTGAKWFWYSGAACCGSPIDSGSTITVSPSVTTTYYVRAIGPCNTTNIVQRTITVKTVSVEPSSILSSNGTLFCSGGASTTLSVNGGTLGTNATWRWYSGSCGGSLVGSGPSIGVNPSSTTTYFVRGEGDCGNSNCTSITISVSSGLSVSISATTNPTCFGFNNGSATATASNGLPPYAYSWSPSGGVNATANSLSAGSYTVLVTDAAGCTATASTTISQPSQVVISNVVKTDAACSGTSTGTITITASGGTGSLQYSIDNGTNYQSSNTFSGLAVGSYNIVVKDANNCTATYGSNPVVVGQPTPLNLLVANTTNPSCSGVNNGAITLTTSGGSSPYQYSLNGSPLQPGATFSNLSAGSYTVIVQDANSCTDTVSASLSNVGGVNIALDSSFDISCFGTNDGEIYVSGSSGTAPYTYTINGTSYQPSGAFSGLQAGIYTVIVRDAAGCTNSVNDTITQPALLTVTVDSVVDVLCAGSNSGGVYISVSGGTQGNFGGGTTFQAFSPSQLSGTSMTGPSWNALSGGALSGRLFADGTCCSGVNTSGPTDTLAFTVSVSGSYTITNTYTGWDGYIHLFSAPLNLNTTSPSVFIAGNDDCPGLANSCVTANLTAGTTYYLFTSGFGNSDNGPWTTAIVGPGQAGQTVPTGGQPYQFSWSNTTSNEDNTGLGAGTYTVTVTDANGCTATATATVDAPPVLSVNLANASQVSCNGGNDGELDVTVTGGVPPYTFNWSNSVTTEDNINLTAGTYNLTVTDDNGCSITASYTVTQPAALVVTGAVTNLTCSTTPSGAIDLTVTGGTAPYTYQWSNFATTQDISNLAAGTYSVIVRDARGCSSSQTFTITSNAALTASIDTIVNILCNGDTTGSVDVIVTGGQLGFSAFPSNQVSGTALTGPSWNALSGGVLTGRLFADGTCCSGVNTSGPTDTLAFTVSVSGSYTITNTYTGWDGYIHLFSAPLNLNTTSPSVFIAGNDDCPGLANSCVTANLTAGTTYYLFTSGFGNSDNGPWTTAFAGPGQAGIQSTGGYTYQWSNGDTTQDLTNVGAGTYTLTVSDGAGCQDTLTVTITEPTAISLSAQSSNVSCNGGNNGSIDLTVTGGVSPYTYAWTGGATTQDLSNLTAGTYSVTVTDANSCTDTLSVTVTQPSPIVVAANVDSIDCNGGTNGSIALSVSGGTPSYTFAWSNGAATATISNLGAGTYTVTITDANGCTLVNSYTLSQPSALQVSLNPVPVACNGASTGSVSSAVTGGTSPYTYLWSNFATTPAISGVPAGSYTLIVTDANGCSASASTTVTQSPAIVLTETITNILCNGGTNGSIEVTATGGNGPFTFSWSTGLVNNGVTTSTITGLGAGTYGLTVTDATGCTASETYILTEPAPLTLSATATDVTCNGAANGSIDLTVTGGTAPYSYSWTGGSTNQDLNNLAGGSYTVNVTDDNGCIASLTVVIDEPAAIDIQGSVIDVTCAGNSNGAVFLTVSGGVTPYTFNWNNGATTQNLVNIAGGTYAVTVTDNNGCTDTASFVVSEPLALTTAITKTDVACFGATTGIADLTVSGGTAPYNYLWSNFATSEDLNGVAAGTYTVVVTDNNGCRVVDTVTINQNTALAITATLVDVSCFGEDDGSIDVAVTGGVAPYTFAWSGGQTTDSIGGLAAGTYDVTVTDDAGCTLVATYTVAQPDALVLDALVTNVSCNGLSNGAIDVTVTGGTAPYTYNWADGSTSADRNGLAAGQYDLTLTDDNGCTATGTYTVTEPDSLVLVIGGTAVSCNGFADGSAGVTVTGGTPPYTYFWSNFRFTPSVTGLVAGEYFVSVSDANGCTGLDSITISQPNPLTVTGTPKGAGCGNDAQGIVDIEANGGTPPYNYIWSTNDTTEDITNLPAGTYSVTVSDANDCSVTFTAVVESLPKPVAGFTWDLACELQDVQFVNTSTISSGTLTYQWSFGDNDSSTLFEPTHIYQDAGTYLVELVAISDQNCFDTVSAVVQVSALPDPTITANGISDSVCVGDSVTLSAPDASVVYEWSTGETAQTVWVNQSGDYSVTVTNASGCALADTIYVNIFEEADITVTADTSISLGYSIQLEATGGVSYLWEPATGLSSTTVANPIATPLTTTTYTVIVSAGEGCTSRRNVTITVNEDFVIEAPNVFSPNGDGIHDYWVITNITTYPVCEVFVFNRWGTEVYSAQDYQNNWDGTNDGEALPDGTYYYIINCSGKVYKGAVTILR
ncbi:MAG: gliding motility-associated C-terminal domain-containing protein [Chitinophagales bacterium]|nr:gliding motility-associated C-terminal domain-containing protein [Chitinophagales bacterium]